MPRIPAFAAKTIDGAAVQIIDWRSFFGGDVRVHDWHSTGEMKQFHVVFRLRVERGGTLVFFDDDGCIIRRAGEIVHEDRECHPLRRHELVVQAGDILEIAHWQYHGDWLWAGLIESGPPSLADDVALFEPFHAEIGRALRAPNGPTLKTYFAATHPVRAALAVHGLILNGFHPDGVQVYGDYQWDAARRRAVEALLPFAEIVPTPRVLDAVREIDGRVVPLAQSVWAAMKICVSLLHPPFEFCFLDDDVFILDRMDDALALFRDHDLVYQTDWDHSDSYQRIWSVPGPLRTGNLNTGVCFVRNRHDRRAQAARLAGTPPDGHPPWLWEQGFMATEFAADRTAALPTQRYFYPIFDGLPGGILEYDWAANPCGFITAHFGGLQNKPTEDQARALARGILTRRRAS